MAEQPRSQTRINANDIPVSNPHAVESTYANNSGVGITLTDIRLIFTEVGQGFSGSTTPAPVNVLKANVVIPPAQAEALIQALTIALQQQQTQLLAFRQQQAQSREQQTVQATDARKASKV